MMAGLLYTVLEISASVSAVILVLLLLSKWLNKRFIAKWRYWVWLVLAIRLLVPVNFHVPEPALKVNVPDRTVATVRAPAAPAASRVSQEVTTAPARQKVQPQKTETQPRSVSAGEIAAAVWLLGAALFLIYQFSKYFVFKRKVLRWSRPAEDAQQNAVLQFVLQEMDINKKIDLRQSKRITSPMMAGFFRPLLLLPEAGYESGELEMILRHELIHYKRRDIWYKLLLAVANAAHWFNPIVWLMAREAGKDVEMVCDAEVVKGKDPAYRKRYGETILAAVHKGEACKTAFSTYFYGGAKAMKERLKNILDTGKKHRGIEALCAVVVVAAILGASIACNMGGNKTNPPQLKVTLPGQETEQSVSGQKADSEESLFVQVMKQTSVDKIFNVNEGSAVNFSFGGTKPDSVTATDILLNSDGKYKYNKGIKPESLKVTEKNGIYAYTVQKNISSYLSSDSDAEKKDIYGYCITAKWGSKTYFYPFVLKLTVNGDTKTIKYGKFEISIPNEWNLSGNILKNNEKNMCELDAIDYDPDQPFSQLYGNHSEEKSKEQITGISYPTTKVVLRRTQPAAAQDDSYTDELHYFIIPENGRAAYDLNFNSSEVSESEALKIVKAFQLISSDIIENVSADIVKQNPSIDIANEFISYDYNYIALFGSLKGDKTQGAAVVYGVNKPANKKQLLAPGKHGKVRAVQLGAKASTVNITADDGYEWVFNVYNGFTGGHEGDKTFSSAPVEHNKVVNNGNFAKLSLGVTMPELDYASKTRVIFHSYFGLFVYDTQDKKILQSLNLEEIGCNHIQGSPYTEVSVSKDGNTVYIKNTDAGDNGYMYVYDINSDKLEQTAAKEVTDRYKTEDITDKLTEIPDAMAEGADSMYGRIDDDTLAFLKDGGDFLAGNLQLVIYNEKTKNKQVCNIFKNEAASTKFIAYIGNYNIKANTVTADRAEWVTSEDTERIKELKLNPDDMPNGFYIYNPHKENENFNIEPTAQLLIIDGSTAKKTDKSSFKSRVDKDKGAGVFWLTEKGNKIIKIEEQYLP